MSIYLLRQPVPRTCVERLLEPVQHRRHGGVAPAPDLVHYAELADLCGKSRPVLRQWYEEHNNDFGGMIVREVAEVAQRYVILVHSPVEVTVVVRGCKNFANMCSIMQCWQVQDTQLRIPLHKGFKDVADAVLVDLQQQLEQLRRGAENGCAPLKVNLTGHSLGGAVCVILAMKLHQVMVNVSIGSVVTFGMPKVTNKMGADVCACRIPGTLTMVNHEHDVIPEMPALWPFIRREPYAHFGESMATYPPFRCCC
jgi:hypothetical protein